MKLLHPKIVIIGAGSLFFGRKLIWAMNQLEGLTGGTLSLVDTDPAHLAGMEALARKSKAASGASFQIEASTDFREALPGADFVVLSFSHRNAHYRGVDCMISERHGVRMCSGDTIGPGGVFRALRELPKVMEIAGAVAEMCPEAWVINYINPSTVLGMALQRHGRTKNFAMCDSLHLPFLNRNYMQMIGLDAADEREFEMRIAGVNHFTWMLKATFRGRDMLPDLRAALEDLGDKENPGDGAKSLFNKRISAKLGSVFGAIPVCTAHTKEYLPYFQGHGVHVADEIVPPLSIFEHEDRERITAQMWEEVNAFCSGKKPISEFLEKGSSDHATDVIQAIWNDSGRHFYVNVPNATCVPNLPADAILELECAVGKSGPLPLPVGNMPLGLRCLQMRILDTHELTVEAFFKKDRNLLLRALAIDPIVNSLQTAEAVLADLYESQKDVVEDWVAPGKPAGGSPPVRARATVHQGETTIS
jgi:alpha-galactosidase/6-phospho-beta-glucosidase family protein